MSRYYYANTISNFLSSSLQEILWEITENYEFQLEQTQRDSWIEEIKILKNVLQNRNGKIFFEYSIPRMGKRIDVVLIIDNIIFIVEFKVGEREYQQSAIDQVVDYGLDLINFHGTSHDKIVAPILLATKGRKVEPAVSFSNNGDKLLLPIKCNQETFSGAINLLLSKFQENRIDTIAWEQGTYSPTPTIIEAAMALYNGHSVEEISRSDASAINLQQTSETIASIIKKSRENYEKSICFVTGVPGAGKTLVGLNIATNHIDKNDDLYSVFLSGNGPLVDILREALARDKIRFDKENGKITKLGEARREVKLFIQNVHHFRDDCLDSDGAPLEHVALFDEAQRAWNIQQTSNFMKRKKGRSNFNISEPEFLISCLDRHKDWVVIVCLVGGGQEINTGEAGISEWIHSLTRTFQNWHIYVSSRITDSEYAAGNALQEISDFHKVTTKDELHLSVSMRSFRSENVSLLVKQLLDLESLEAQKTLRGVSSNYPVVLTRDLSKAKQWLKEKARGTERYGIIVSSQAFRLKPHAIDVRPDIDPIHWFLDGKTDTRSSYYLEDVATEFQVQGLELDWTCVVWDADFRFSKQGWEHRSFVGDKWNNINKTERKIYQKNAYRVLLTRARQGMIIVVPNGDAEDPTRKPGYYDPTYEYLKNIGFTVI